MKQGWYSYSGGSAREFHPASKRIFIYKILSRSDFKFCIYGTWKRRFCQERTLRLTYLSHFLRMMKMQKEGFMKYESGLLEQLDIIMEKYGQAHDELEALWADKIVFDGHWWLDMALAVLPWVFWLIVRDKKRQHSLLYAGLFSALVATVLCMVGVAQGGWNYNTMLIPYFPEYLPWDLTIMPVVTMLFLQYFPKISPWLKGAAFTVIASYAVEPLFIWLGMYDPSSWEHHYSLPIYFVIFMLSYLLYKRSCREADKRV